LSQAAIDPASFAGRLLAWWRENGRHDLPWQIERSPYRVWISEIMLQQTQVRTVTPYFQRFMDRFPDLQALAESDLDDVLSQWTGLGYYARARNLHAAARRAMSDHGGELPARPEQLLDLPGIGRSTANAIIAQAWNHRAPILDGNVKRVLSRHAAIEGWPGRSAVEKMLWQEADLRTPQTHAAAYTQAIMDLGATLCTARAPGCQGCPVRADCLARQADRVADFPGRKPRKARPHRRSLFLILRNQADDVLLIQRPPSGIWGGLWCLPEAGPETAHLSEPGRETIPPIVHEFTHFRLTMEFLHLDAITPESVRDWPEGRWVRPGQGAPMGLPRPIQILLETLEA